MCQPRWLRLPLALALGIAAATAACDRPDPVALAPASAVLPAGTVVPTPGGDLSITTVPLQVPSGYLGVAQDVNNAGVIVGYYDTPITHMTMVAVRWDLAGSMTVLPLPSACTGGFSRAFGVNEVGDIVGDCTVTAGEDLVTRAVLWPKGGTPVVLPPPSGYTEALARDVNNRGDVVGTAYGASTWAPVLWSKGQAEILASPDGYTAGDAFVISEGGLIVGTTTGNPIQTVLWEKGLPRVLTLPTDWPAGSPMAINPGGAIVGHAYRSSPYASVPLLWDRAGNPTTVPIGMAVNDPTPYGISAATWIVGTFGACPSADACAFLWSASTGTVLLSFPGTSGASLAKAISESGYIVGWDNYALATGPALLWIVALTPPATP